MFNGTNQSMESSPESEELTVHIQFENDVPEELICEASNAVSKIRTEALACGVATEDMEQRVYRVGATVLLELRQNVSASEMDDVHWKLNGQLISKKRHITHQNKEKYSMFKNSTLQIHDGRKTDSGNYSVIIYNSKGLHIVEEKTHLTFLEPVSEVRVWRPCSEHRNITVTCSVESGDDVHFLWTWMFNGTNQSMESSPESEELTVHIQFENDVPEELICEASNAVSKIRTNAPLCRGYLSTLAAAVLFLTVVLGVGFVTVIRKMRKDHKKVTEENIYLDMRGFTQNRTPPEQSRTSPPDNSTYDIFRPLQQNSSSEVDVEDVYVL
ncbi:T-cell surface antigen CD2-like [Colossoma macropomum]|uniref:T-cell surface antigen CD2-like n=1 Tax=Colossoma macropomum TaxID=42526 RepID=UPI001864A1F2|nr:T-cell surface antigen CD2-like [Colossoma macropomum]